MATIRRRGKGWQALIRKKDYLGQKTKTFPSKRQAQLWANAVGSSLQISTQLTDRVPKIFQEAIDLYIQGPLQTHRSGQSLLRPLSGAIFGVLIPLAAQKHLFKSKFLVLLPSESLFAIRLDQ